MGATAALAVMATAALTFDTELPILALRPWALPLTIGGMAAAAAAARRDHAKAALWTALLVLTLTAAAAFSTLHGCSLPGNVLTAMVAAGLAAFGAAEVALPAVVAAEAGAPARMPISLMSQAAVLSGVALGAVLLALTG